MASYFDPNDQSHLAFLPPPIRMAETVERMAPIAEADVINHFTEVPRPSASDLQDLSQMGGASVTSRLSTQVGSSVFRVFLRGYEQDADDVDTAAYPNLKLDMVRTIAMVIVWRMQQEKREPDALSEASSTGKSITYRSDRLEPFPPNWDRWLRKYDTREPGWGF